jgi:hypothetical protein
MREAGKIRMKKKVDKLKYKEQTQNSEEADPSFIHNNAVAE